MHVNSYRLSIIIYLKSLNAIIQKRQYLLLVSLGQKDEMAFELVCFNGSRLNKGCEFTAWMKILIIAVDVIGIDNPNSSHQIKNSLGCGVWFPFTYIIIIRTFNFFQIFGEIFDEPRIRSIVKKYLLE